MKGERGKFKQDAFTSRKRKRRAEAEVEAEAEVKARQQASGGNLRISRLNPD